MASLSPEAREKTHPLQGHKLWRFWQPRLGIASGYSSRSLKDGKRRAKYKTLQLSDTCRETVIYNLRTAMQAHLFSKKTNSYTTVFTQVAEIDFSHLQKDQRTTLFIHESGVGYRFPGEENYTSAKASPKNIQEFIEVCDRICGVIAVLLFPDRREGDWWRSDPGTCKDLGGFIHWNGCDNNLLRHPAMVSIMTGFYRQCALLCAGGFGPEIINALPREAVDQMLTASDWKAAHLYSKTLRQWIEVPGFTGPGGVSNIPFPCGFWRRLMRLQRALRRHGYEKVFDQSFEEGWNFTGNNTQWSGLYSLWGYKGHLTDAHTRVIKLGQPKKIGAGDAQKNGAEKDS